MPECRIRAVFAIELIWVRSLIENTDIPQVLIFGDRVDDIYVLPIKSRGGHGQSDDDTPITFDWQNHAQWQQFKIAGGVNMTHTMLRWYSGALSSHMAKVVSGNQTPAQKPLKSIAVLSDCDENGVVKLPVAFQSTAHNAKDSDLALRVQRDLGYAGQETTPVRYARPDTLQGHPTAIVVNDAGSELRHSSPTENFFCDAMDVQAQNEGANTHVIMKMHLPLVQGLAWQKFKSATSAASRILIVHADDLRMAGVPISQCPSWDHCVEDVKRAWTLRNDALRELSDHCTALVILFDVEGALVLQTTPEAQPRTTLICDPTRGEGDVSNALPGHIVGKMNCFLAHLTYEVLCRNDAANLMERVREALVTMRHFAESTYQVRGKTLAYRPVGDWMRADKLPRDRAQYQVIEVPSNAGTDLLAACIAQKGSSLKTLAEDIVLEGVDAKLSDLPHGRFGELRTVDVEEIEAMRAVDQLISSYLNAPSQSKPLSLAVFGPPGAGKSFGVSQLVDKNTTPIREYNLSQANAAQLPAFFHEIRDLNLRGKTPLCFFDEFDSQNRELLKYFLAPMQDGTFLEGNAVRPIGAGIFVFAGGTAATMDLFANPTFSKEEAKAQKLPDFVSRLQGFINVKGPNAVAKGGNPETPFLERCKDDPSYIVRRAILLRTFLKKHLGSVISDSSKRASIEPQLLRALLFAEDYVHGARSLEMLIKSMAVGSRKRSLGRSDLPIDSQLQLFVTPLKAFTSQLSSKV